MNFEHAVSESKRKKWPLFVTMPSTKKGEELEAKTSESYRLWYKYVVGNSKNIFILPTHANTGILQNPTQLAETVTPETTVYAGGGQIYGCLGATIHQLGLPQKVVLMDKWCESKKHNLIKFTNAEFERATQYLRQGKNQELFELLQEKNKSTDRQFEYRHLSVLSPHVTKKVVYDKLSL